MACALVERYLAILHRSLLSRVMNKGTALVCCAPHESSTGNSCVELSLDWQVSSGWHLQGHMVRPAVLLASDHGHMSKPPRALPTKGLKSPPTHGCTA